MAFELFLDTEFSGLERFFWNWQKSLVWGHHVTWKTNQRKKNKCELVTMHTWWWTSRWRWWGTSRRACHSRWTFGPGSPTRSSGSPRPGALPPGSKTRRWAGWKSPGSGWPTRPWTPPASESGSRGPEDRKKTVCQTVALIVKTTTHPVTAFRDSGSVHLPAKLWHAIFFCAILDA